MSHPNQDPRVHDHASCAVVDCIRPAKTRGWCNAHYIRWRRWGDPRGKRPLRPEMSERLTVDPLERFWRLVMKGEPAECWEWTGAKTSDGYGCFSLNVLNIGAHRAAYELLVGPIPEGLEIDHLCRNRGCVNPAHLEPVTHDENMARRPRPTHCRNGHAYDDENTIYDDSSGAMRCLTCRIAQGKAGRFAERRAS